MKFKRLISLIFVFFCVAAWFLPGVVVFVSAADTFNIVKFTDFDYVVNANVVTITSPVYNGFSYALQNKSNYFNDWHLASDSVSVTGDGTTNINFYQDYLSHPKSMGHGGANENTEDLFNSMFYIGDIVDSDPSSIVLKCPFVISCSVPFSVLGTVFYYDENGSFISSQYRDQIKKFSSASNVSSFIQFTLSVPSNARYCGVTLYGYPQIYNNWVAGSTFSIRTSVINLIATYSSDPPDIFGGAGSVPESRIEILPVGETQNNCCHPPDSDFPGDRNTLRYTKKWHFAGDAYLHRNDSQLFHIAENPAIIPSDHISAPVTLLKSSSIATKLGGKAQMVDVSYLRSLDPLRFYIEFDFDYMVDISGQMRFYIELYELNEQGYETGTRYVTTFTPTPDAGYISYVCSIEVPEELDSFYVQVIVGRNNLDYAPTITIYDCDMSFCCVFASKESDFPEETEPPTVPGSVDLSGVESQLGDIEGSLGDIDSSLSDMNGKLTFGFLGISDELDSLGGEISSRFDDVDDAIVSMDSSINQGLDDLGDSINQGLSDVEGAINDGLNDLDSSINQGLDDLGQGIGENIDGLEATIDQGLSDVESAIDDTNDKIEQSNSLLGNVVDGITSLPKKILDGIVGLFVPTAQDLEVYQDKWDTLLQSRFGALYESGQLITQYAQSFEEKAATNTVEFPSITLDLAGVPFSFGGWQVKVVPDGFDELFDMLKWMISLIATLGMVNALRNKFDRLLGGS